MAAAPGDPNGVHPPTLSDAEEAHFTEFGFVLLGRCAPLPETEALGERIDQIMLGDGADFPTMMMSVCPSETGSWDHPATLQTPGFKYPTLGYRKIQGLEQDNTFRSWVRKELFRDITSRLIPGESVCINRAMYFAKPAATEGVRIDWHQDNSAGNGAASVTVWTALDETTLANGCLQIAPRSHKAGPVKFGSTTSNEPTLSPQQEAELTATKIHLPMRKGESVLLNNMMLHRSDPNTTGKPRRGFSVWYCPASPAMAKVFPDYVPAPIPARL